MLVGPSGSLKDTLQEYLKVLTCALKNAHLSALSAQHAGDLKNTIFNVKVKNHVQVGDEVMIQKIGNLGPMSSKYEGPYSVLLTTPTSLLVEIEPGLTRWMQLAQVKPLSPLADTNSLSNVI